MLIESLENCFVVLLQVLWDLQIDMSISIRLEYNSWQVFLDSELSVSMIMCCLTTHKQWTNFVLLELVSRYFSLSSPDEILLSTKYDFVFWKMQLSFTYCTDSHPGVKQADVVQPACYVSTLLQRLVLFETVEHDMHAIRELHLILPN